jgi:Nuclease-related domain
VARRLEKLQGPCVFVLHDRRIPRSTANIDHIVVGAAGIYVIDSKHYKGRIERRSTGTFLGHGSDKLFVAARDQTTIVDGMARQVAAVEAAVGDLTDARNTPIRPVICFVQGEWSLLAKPFVLDGVTITRLNALTDLVRTPGPLNETAVQALGRHLRSQLPAA